MGLSWQASLPVPRSITGMARTGGLGRAPEGFQTTPQTLLLVIFGVGKKASGPGELEKADAKPEVFFFFFFSGVKLLSS